MKTKNDTKKLLPKFEAVTLSEADLQQVSGGKIKENGETKKGYDRD